MKIGLDNAPASPVGGYSQHLAKVLGDHAPGHEYVVGGKHYNELDIYHGFRPLLPFVVRMRRVPSVLTVSNLHFLRYPKLYSFTERIFLLWAYRRSLRSASRLITLNTPAREELAQRLGIARERIDVVMPLAALAPCEAPVAAALESVRRKYDLPKSFLLMLGTVEPRHNHEAVLEALHATGLDAGLVICGRRTAWSELLLRKAREWHMACLVDFIYEPSLEDLPSLFRLARGFVYLPDAVLEASIVPVVEALRSGVPMLLSDTQLNREAASDAAIYVRPEAEGELAAALENLVADRSLREELVGRGRQRAELFSEYAVAQRLMDIYSSL